MKIAISEAKKAYDKQEVPIGAVLVNNQTQKVIAKSHNLVEKNQNITFHSEMNVINKAIKKLKIKYLTDIDLDLTLYSTLEPCSMCAGAIIHSKIKTVVIGTKDPKSGAAGSVLNILQNPKLNHQCELIFGILEKDCSDLLKGFFIDKRRDKKSVKRQIQKNTL